MEDILAIGKERLEPTDFLFKPKLRKNNNYINITACIILILVAIMGITLSNNNLNAYINQIQDKWINAFAVIISGIISGGLTVLGVVIAFNLQERRTIKDKHSQISNRFSRYVTLVYNTYLCLQDIKEYINNIKYEKYIDKEKIYNLKKKIENTEIDSIIKEFKGQNIFLVNSAHILTELINAYYMNLEKNWITITDLFFKSIEDDKKKDELYIKFDKAYEEYYGIARLIVTTINAINVGVDRAC
ncbi:hypothetical protein FC789_12765 [Clostridium botulinum]|uniref:hypothetical protein n=1 Tax=Clostridium sp. CH2 TaxID=2949990 RepID=UPI0013F13D59|nr:hypothetical protein [Clostridium sp. CH2]NFG42045.1 hypothetical protein [Clostridium botulinum]